MYCKAKHLYVELNQNSSLGKTVGNREVTSKLHIIRKTSHNFCI